MKRRSFITLLGGTPTTTTTTTTTRHDALRAATVLRRLSADVLMFASVGWARTADSRPCMPSHRPPRVMALCWLWLNQICEPHAARSGTQSSKSDYRTGPL
jgi:hypothetical protein